MRDMLICLCVTLLYAIEWHISLDLLLPLIWYWSGDTDVSMEKETEGLLRPFDRVVTDRVSSCHVSTRERGEKKEELVDERH
jgi:hypothetical protein